MILVFYDIMFYFCLGEITKVCNNLKEYCPTEALCISRVQERDYLFSVGSDVDSGDSYINGECTSSFIIFSAVSGYVSSHQSIARSFTRGSSPQILFTHIYLCAL